VEASFPVKTQIQNLCWQEAMPSHPGKGHKYPYFKVQAWDPLMLAWRDHRKEAFDDEVSARAYRAKLGSNIETRIMKWDDSGATPLVDSV
jgi:hypothetical protein